MHDQHRVLRWENRGRQLALLFMWNRCQFSELEVLGQSTHWRWKRASQNGYGEDVLLQVEISGEDGSVDLRVYVYAALSVVQIFTRNSIIQFSFSFEWDSLIQKRSMYLLQFSDPPARIPITAADSYKSRVLTRCSSWQYVYRILTLHVWLINASAYVLSIFLWSPLSEIVFPRRRSSTRSKLARALRSIPSSELTGEWPITTPRSLLKRAPWRGF